MPLDAISSANRLHDRDLLEADEAAPIGLRQAEREAEALLDDLEELIDRFQDLRLSRQAPPAAVITHVSAAARQVDAALVLLARRGHA